MRIPPLAASAGVWLLWLASVPASHAQLRRSDIQVGGHYGFNFSNGEVEDARLGLQALVPVLGPLELGATGSRYINFIDDPSGRLSGSAWQAHFMARIRPAGRGSFASLGYGAIMINASVRDNVQGIELSDTEWFDAIVIGLELPLSIVRPFGELYLIDILKRQGAVGGNALFGLNVRLP